MVFDVHTERIELSFLLHRAIRFAMSKKIPEPSGKGLSQ